MCDRAGYSYPLNVMLDCSSGLYVAILDHDDLMNENRIQIQFDFLEKNPEICAVGSSIRLIDSSGEVIGRQIYESHPRKIRKALLHKTPMAHPSAMMRRSAVYKVGGYRDFYDTAEDFDLWSRLSESYNLSNLVENLTDYRLHESQVTSTSRYRNLTASLAAMQSARLRKRGLSEIHDRYESPQAFGRVLHIRIKLHYRIYCEKLLRKTRMSHLSGSHWLTLCYFTLLFIVSPRQGIWALKLGFRSLTS
jgi:glycosyltransferase involved in cell wall biosynthesis